MRQKVVLADDANPPGLLGVDLRRAAEFLTVRAVIVGERADVGHAVRDSFRRQPPAASSSLRHLVPSSAAETFDDRARFFAAERPQLAGEDNCLAGVGNCSGNRIGQPDTVGSRWSRTAPMSNYNRARTITMILAGDIGGTKTLLGLFECRRHAPRCRCDAREFRTTRLRGTAGDHR